MHLEIVSVIILKKTRKDPCFIVLDYEEKISIGCNNFTSTVPALFNIVPKYVKLETDPIRFKIQKFFGQISPRNLGPTSYTRMSSAIIALF